jgi:hypothetical protein
VTTEATARIYLHTAALGFSEQVNYSGSFRDADRPTGVFEAYEGASQFLVTTALAYAGALGNLDAAERAELDALRRFRDGVVALRGELATGKTGEGDPIAAPGEHAVEAIDAFLAVSYPAIGAGR